MPAGVDKSDTAKIQVQRQRTKPVQDGMVRGGALTNRLQKGLMLDPPRRRMQTQKTTGSVGIRRPPPNGIEFMIAHHGLCATGFDHFPHDAHGLQLFWTTVDENDPALRMTSHSIPLKISELSELCPKPGGMAVNVAEHIEQLLFSIIDPSDRSPRQSRLGRAQLALPMRFDDYTSSISMPRGRCTCSSHCSAQQTYRNSYASLWLGEPERTRHSPIC